MSKVYVKGTKVRFHYCVNLVGTEGTEDHVLEKDYSEEALDEEAFEIAMEALQPESWYEVIEGEGND